MKMDWIDYSLLVHECLSEMLNIKDLCLKSNKDLELHSSIEWALKSVYDIIENNDSDSVYEKLKQLYNDTDNYAEIFQIKHPQKINHFAILHDIVSSIAEYVFDETWGFNCGFGESWLY